LLEEEGEKEEHGRRVKEAFAAYFWMQLRLYNAISRGDKQWN